eukprot:PhM_4_TR15747/c0_g1_i1/m.91932
MPHPHCAADRETALNEWEKRLIQWERDLTAASHSKSNINSSNENGNETGNNNNNMMSPETNNSLFISVLDKHSLGEQCQSSAEVEKRERRAAVNAAENRMTFSETSLRLVKPLVFGGLDGLTTTLALVFSAIGAGESTVSSTAVVILGLGNLLATGLSMGLGDFIGTLAEHDALQTAADRRHALRSGLTMFTSFIVFGGIPLLAYTPLVSSSITVRRTLTTVFCFMSLFMLGVVRATMTRGPLIRTGVMMLVIGTLASFVSFAASRFIFSVMGDPENKTPGPVPVVG